MNNKKVFLKRVKEYFNEDYEAFLDELKKPQTHGFCINTKKANKDNILKLIDFKYEDYNKYSFRHSNLNIGKSIAYELGLIYPQGLEASEPCLLPNITNLNVVLDMCAAPGGKSINILNRIDNNTLLISNEYDRKRVNALSSNLERMGYENVIVCSKSTDELTIQLKNACDLVILDAPCSGEGMIRKYPEILEQYSLKNKASLAKLQEKLLEDAYKCLKPNGQLLYSTCTYAKEEDEDVVDSFIRKHQDMSFASNYKKLSFLDNTEGQFMVLLKKNNVGDIHLLKPIKTIRNTIVDKFIKDNMNIDNYFLYKQNNNFYLSLIQMPNLKNNVLKYGLYLGNINKERFEPDHSIYRSNIISFKNVYDMNEQEYLKYISGNEININKENGYYQVTYKSFPVGFGKLVNGRLKNKYPKGLRRVI